MKPFLLIGVVLFLCVTAFGQYVGIGTTSPLALLHVQDSSVIFSAAGDLPFNPGSLPSLGAGRRMIWYPGKAAFRAGYVENDQWDQDNIGSYSFAAGSNTIAEGTNSTALGSYTNALGENSTALGGSTTASGPNCVAMGQNTTASGVIAIAMGENTTANGYYSTAMGFESYASGWAAIAMGGSTTATGYLSTAMGHSSMASSDYSTAMGGYTEATGTGSTAMGFHTIAKGIASTSIGWFNDNTDTPDELIPAPTDRLFQIGNGDSDGITRSNAFTVLRNSNTGIGITTPAFPLTFAPLIGQKIGLWYDGNSNGNTYGIGIASGLLQIHTDVDYADIAFGYGSSANLVETMRVKGNGNVGIGTNAPTEKLEVNGNIICTNLIQTSDARLKKDLVPIENSLARISQIHGYNYNWIDPSMGTSLQSGVMGQELQKLFPELVHEDPQGQLSVNYSGLIPVLIESIKEQQRQIDELKSIVDLLLKQ